jgi:hypothetical protein
VLIRQSKTDQEGQEAELAILRDATRPVAAVRDTRRAAQRETICISLQSSGTPSA